MSYNILRTASSSSRLYKQHKVVVEGKIYVVVVFYFLISIDV
jgi:hypothetical protein